MFSNIRVLCENGKILILYKIINLKKVIHFEKLFVGTFH